MNQTLDRLAREIAREFELELERVGILFRIFVRAKTGESIERKFNFKKYGEDGGVKLMQDVIGIRITLYFNDDLETVYKIIKTLKNFTDETIDGKSETVFKPERTNLIFKLNARQSREVKDVMKGKYGFIDSTYEVQLRTVLSEGWHEVDHDLRYKCEPDWVGCSEIARTFNGVYAALTTNDWAILNIFEKLAYKHYKNKNWHAMLRQKFRLRFKDENLQKEIVEILNADPELAKRIFKVERSEFIESMYSKGIKIPLTLSNIVFLANALCLDDRRLWEITPALIGSHLRSLSSDA